MKGMTKPCPTPTGKRPFPPTRGGIGKVCPPLTRPQVGERGTGATRVSTFSGRPSPRGTNGHTLFPASKEQRKKTMKKRRKSLSGPQQQAKSEGRRHHVGQPDAESSGVEALEPKDAKPGREPLPPTETGRKKGPPWGFRSNTHQREGCL